MTFDVENIAKHIDHEESLSIFLRKVVEFNTSFCNLMVKGNDFTLRLEVRGNKQELLHARVYFDEREAPDGAQKRIDEKLEKK